MNLLTSFRAELLKTKRTSSWYLAIAIPAIMPLLSIVGYDQANADDKIRSNPWRTYFTDGFQMTNFIILPMFVILICTLLPQIECRNNTWKQVLASPQRRRDIYAARYLHVVLMIGVFLVSYTVFALLAVAAIEFISPAYTFHAYPLELSMLLEFNLKTFACVLGMSALQFWMGLHFKSFVAPIAIGFGLWFVAGMMVFEWKLPYAYIHPFAYPIYSVLEKPEAQQHTYILGSMGYCLLFLIAGFLDFRGRKV